MQIQAALDRNNGNLSKTARELGIPRTTLRWQVSQFEKQENPAFSGGFAPQGTKSTQNFAPKRHLVIPDVQAKEGVPFDHLPRIGQYIADKRPDVIVCIGDFADMPSLSSYDVGKKSFEGRRYKKDIAACHEAMKLLCEPFCDIPDYKPRMILTLGNHENRIDRAVENDPKLDGLISVDDLKYESWGWEVIPYLKPIAIDGIEYVHYVTSGVMGRAASSAQVALRERQGSVVQGHVQHIDIAIHKKTQNFALFAGICYQHHEDYLGAQGNGQKAGVWILNEVNNGQADLLQISLNYLRRRYGS